MGKTGGVSYDFDAAKSEWLRIPIDDVGYINANELLASTPFRLRQIARKFEKARYSLDRWRNAKNGWREYLGLDTTTGKTILDYGCGFGIESLQFAKKGNEVIVADINQPCIDLAEKVLNAFGYKPLDKVLIRDPLDFKVKFDIFYANGVLHHTPKFREVLLYVSEKCLAPDGEVRLMLYSDMGWRNKVSTNIPYGIEDITTHPDYFRFLRKYDSVGNYADFYYPEKIHKTVGDFLDLERFEYITNDGSYCVAILRKK